MLENSHKIHSTENQLKSPVCREVIGVAIDARSNRGNFGDCDDESIEGCCTIEFILLKGPLEDCLRLHSMSLSEALTALEAKGFLGKGEKGQGKQRRFTHPILAGQTRGYPILAGILNFK